MVEQTFSVLDFSTKTRVNMEAMAMAVKETLYYFPHMGELTISAVICDCLDFPEIDNTIMANFAIASYHRACALLGVK